MKLSNDNMFGERVMEFDFVAGVMSVPDYLQAVIETLKVLREEAVFTPVLLTSLALRAPADLRMAGVETPLRNLFESDDASGLIYGVGEVPGAGWYVDPVFLELRRFESAVSVTLTLTVTDALEYDVCAEPQVGYEAYRNRLKGVIDRLRTEVFTEEQGGWTLWMEPTMYSGPDEANEFIVNSLDDLLEPAYLGPQNAVPPVATEAEAVAALVRALEANTADAGSDAP